MDTLADALNFFSSASRLSCTCGRFCNFRSSCVKWFECRALASRTYSPHAHVIFSSVLDTQKQSNWRISKFNDNERQWNLPFRKVIYIANHVVNPFDSPLFIRGSCVRINAINPS